jgi:hypothetical protein
MKYELLLATDHQGRTVRDEFGKHYTNNLLLHLWNFAKKNLTSEEIKDVS